jgi:hypothetical protein
MTHKSEAAFVMMWPLNANHWPGDDFEWEDSDLPYGWAGTVIIPTSSNFNEHAEIASQVVSWMRDTIENPFANARWHSSHDRIYVQLRKKKDYLWFVTRWGCT